MSTEWGIHERNGGRLNPATRIVALLVVGAVAIGMPVAASPVATTGGAPAGTPTSATVSTVPATGYSANDTGSLNAIARIIGVPGLWSSGYTGSGIGVAVIDTGVTRVPGLAARGQVVDGPDLSFDSQSPTLAHLDSYGHGTHMAGIIAGRDPAPNSSASRYSDANQFVGIAPDAHIVNVKVGSSDGAADVSQVIAGIDWVVQHRNDPGMNIKVLSLSYGTNATQPYQVDPLAYAAEVAWRNGIVVVASGGNDGRAVPALANPGYDPTVLAVGSDDPNGTLDRLNDVVPAFVTHGTAVRPVDVIAPGVSVISLRVPGSYIDTTYPGGTIGTRFQRGSGTSQSTAVVAGLVALLRQRFPNATPDQIKSLLTGSAYRINANLLFAGKGIVDGGAATLLGVQTLTSLLGGVTKPLVGPAPATGVGSLEASRGDSHVVTDGANPLTGERDIFGKPFVAPAMALAENKLSSWNGGTWNASVWTGPAWTAGAWPSIAWTGTDWAGSRWKGSRWKSAVWDGSRWKNADWTSGGWSGSRWKDSTWSGSRWR